MVGGDYDAVSSRMVSDPVQERSSSIGAANLLIGLRIDEYFTRKDSSNNVSTLLQDALGCTIGPVGSAQSRRR